MFPQGSAFLTGCSRVVRLSMSLLAFSISSFSFFFCSSALFASALLGSSSANAGAANDVMIAAITRVLMSISLPQGIRALPREGPTRLSGADSERCLPQAARAPGRNDGLHDDEQDLARFRRHTLDESHPRLGEQYRLWA